jgi:hypothetical protein
MASLAIGIAIGMAFGIILMMLSITRKDTDETPDPNDLDTQESEAKQAGFIEIDYGKMSDSNQFEDTGGVYGLKRKLARFKLKNRFYN